MIMKQFFQDLSSLIYLQKTTKEMGSTLILPGSNKLGILKYSVPEFINNNNSLMNLIKEIKEAKIEDGGEGAFYIYLKKNKNI